MEIVQTGKTMGGCWEAEIECSGAGNGGSGCEAILKVSETDLYQTYKSCMGRDETWCATFMCPCCGTETDIANTDGYRHSEWPGGRLQIKELPKASGTQREEARILLQTGEGYAPPHKVHL